MELYSAAIEHYNIVKDEVNQRYYVEKMNLLNVQIKGVLEMQQRAKRLPQKAEQSPMHWS